MDNLPKGALGKPPKPLASKRSLQNPWVSFLPVATATMVTRAHHNSENSLTIYFFSVILHHFYARKEEYYGRRCSKQVEKKA